MQSHKISLKLFLADGAKVAAEDFVPVFHGWIQRHAITDHLLIDVADYAHVHQGPGTVLIAHEANIYLEDEEGRPGLRYDRKQPLSQGTSLEDRLMAVFRYTLAAADLIEKDAALGGRARFNTGEMQLRIQDRLLAPNTAETFAGVHPALESVVRKLYGGATATLSHQPDPLRMFQVKIIVPADAGVSAMLSRL